MPPEANAITASPRKTRGFWWLGIALLAAVVLVVLQRSEEREFVRLLEAVSPAWLAAALVLQASTYLARAEIWRGLTRTASAALPAAAAYELSLAELFFDQALPSAGLSGTALVAKALERRGIARPLVMASVAVSMSSYYATYALCLGAALLMAAASGRAGTTVVVVAVLFVAYCMALSAGVWLVAGSVRPLPRPLTPLERIPLFARALDSLRQADRTRARDPRRLLRAGALQLAIVLLDAGTLWTLVRALGGEASPGGVFASYVLASLVRMLSFVPGGLGAFDVASVMALNLTGVAVPLALSATLLYRGLSFWLPMLPGFLFSRRALGARARTRSPDAPEDYWTLPVEELCHRLGSGPGGLATTEAAVRLEACGPNELQEQPALSRLRVLWNQVRSPLILLLAFAAGASALSGQWIDSGLVLVILVASAWIGYSREYRAQDAAAELRSRVRTQASVVRDGRTQKVPARELVPGDIVLLSAGSLAPADGVLLEATDFFVNEAVLTGESFPVEKRPGPVAREAGLTARTNCTFLGTNARSGTARCLVVATGPATQFGAIARRLTLRPPETEFERGMRRFGYLLTTAMLVLVLVVFAANVLLGRAPVETLLFSVALAVGLSPELLPAILSINLARGAKLMARQGVLVRRLSAIEDLGSMDVLCTDKTGTLTEGVVRLEGAYDERGQASALVLELAHQNAALQTGLANPLDDAILQAGGSVPSSVEKVAEIPYDFVRKRLSVVVRGPAGIRLVTKGAFEPVLEACTRTADGALLDVARRTELARRFQAWSGQGIRVLAVATRALAEQPAYGRGDERELQFAGFLTFLDRPKQGVDEALRDLKQLGVAVKLITGDVGLVARHVAASVGMRAERVLTGKQLDELHDEALWRSAEETDLFVEVDPNQKERIILALKKMGHVVGFLGDGVNDAPAMHAADTSLSVQEAVDVAREAADFVLLERRLDVIRRGIEDGRKTFANTQKYVLTTTSANLGNMLSMAAASLFLPFLPLLAGQILLNNFLSDVPAFGLADDGVDPELVDRPRRWDMRFIGRFMVEFGFLSSLFDFLTFGLLLWPFAATPEQFRSAWFVESLLTELAIALVVRTRRPFFRSRPGNLLLWSTLALVPLTFALPYLPMADVLGFTPLPLAVLFSLAGITLLYVAAAELAKRGFYRRAA